MSAYRKAVRRDGVKPRADWGRGELLVNDEREAAWIAVHEALPAYWRVGPVTYDPGRCHWSVTARDDARGRGRLPTTVSGIGENEIAALRDLDARLRGRPRPADDAAKRAKLEPCLRLAFYAGAEEWTRGEFGRGLTLAESVRVLERYLGLRQTS